MKAMLLLFATCLVTQLESYGSEEHAKKVFVEVLRDDSELRLACAGIPLELIVDRYFITERWYRAGRGSWRAG